MGERVGGMGRRRLSGFRALWRLGLAGTLRLVTSAEGVVKAPAQVSGGVPGSIGPKPVTPA